jgi:isoamylase
VQRLDHVAKLVKRAKRVRSGAVPVMGGEKREGLISPIYGKCIARPAGRNREAARYRGDNAATAPKSVVVDPNAYDWEEDAPLGRLFAKTIIYEMHVGGFTRHQGSGVTPSKRGTYAGLIEKIPYLQDLGISAVELLPVYAFDEEDGPPGLSN